MSADSNTFFRTINYLGIGVLIAVCCCASYGANISILNYNVRGIGAYGTDARQALQRIVDYFEPDIITFQEAKGTTNPNDFLTVNSDYEGFYSTEDGAHNRRMIMSKFDIIDESVREYSLGPDSYRTLFAATIDLPGPNDMEIFTAHWDYERTGVRDVESSESISILQAYRSANPDSFYIYAGDFNDEDTSYRITNMFDPNVGLNPFTPIDLNNGNNATINSDPNAGTYLDRRIDYILPSDRLASVVIHGRILNTWTYSTETIPSGLQLTDTINASDHLPVYMLFELSGHCRYTLSGDMNDDCKVNLLDFAMVARNWLIDCNLNPTDPACTHK